MCFFSSIIKFLLRNCKNHVRNTTTPEHLLRDHYWSCGRQEINDFPCFLLNISVSCEYFSPNLLARSSRLLTVNIETFILTDCSF